MSINSQPSSVKADGTGLVNWFQTNQVTFTATPVSMAPAGFPLYVPAPAYAELLKTDPWLDSLQEAGIISSGDVPQTVIDTIVKETAGNDAPAANVASDVAAGTDVGNGGTSDANGAGMDPVVSDTPAADDNAGNVSADSSGSVSQDSSQIPQAEQGNADASVDTGATGSTVVVSGDQPPPEPVVITDPVTETSTAVAWLEEFAKTASVDAKAIINSILTYVREMAPGRTQTPEAMQRQQLNLHSALTGAINRLDGEFKQVWGGVLRLFHEHRDGVFGERYVYRQLQNAPMNPQQRAAFQNVVNMIKLTADPQGRKAGLRQFDKDRTMQHGLTEQGRNKLLSFYNL